MKILKVICIMLFGPVLGMGIAFLAASLLLPPDPSGRGAPGDGFLIIGFVGVGLVVGVVISLLLAVKAWRRSAKHEIAT
jgi:hypothetical protein